jgi:hypothetical protein
LMQLFHSVICLMYSSNMRIGERMNRLKAIAIEL